MPFRDNNNFKCKTKTELFSPKAMVCLKIRPALPFLPCLPNFFFLEVFTPACLSTLRLGLISFNHGKAPEALMKGRSLSWRRMIQWNLSSYWKAQNGKNLYQISQRASRYLLIHLIIPYCLDPHHLRLQLPPLRLVSSLLLTLVPSKI
jgi:hypothetical protein